jgi:PAS domain S-box-containing protein
LLIPDELQADEDRILAQLRAGRYIDHFETVRITKDGRRLDVSLSISPIKNSEGKVIGASKIIRDVTTRKLAEEQLVATTAKFESVFNQSGLFAGITDPAGNLREINALALEWCGYDRAEVLDKPFWATPWWRGSDDVQGRIRFATERAAAGEAFRETLPYWLADGTERIVDFAMHPIRDEHGDVGFLLPTGIDITERTRAEEALRAQEAQEREIAVELQRALLPDQLFVPPGVSCAARYEAGSAALEVGGDWYDAFELPGGRVAVTVGDVVGHGLAAGVAMGRVRTALAALAEYSSSPGELLSRLSGFLDRTKATDFATVCYGVLDPSTGVFEYASAGHPPMLVASPSGVVRRLEGGRSLPLGGDGDSIRPQASTVLEPGSLLVLYTDGLVERRGERLLDSVARLERVVGELARQPVGEVCDRLVAELGVQTSRQDDVAVLAVRLELVTERSFTCTIMACPEELRDLRASLRAWLERCDVAARVRSALLVATGEACSNAIEHAYRDRKPGSVTVEIEVAADGSLDVTVRDFGRFRQPSASDERDDRGRGSDLMRALTSDFRRDETPAGTTVRFRLPMDEAA